MALILIGLILWTWPHVMKLYTPGLRAGVSEKTARPVVALITILSVILMVIGYRGADIIPVYAPPVWGQHLNNLLMVFSVLLLGTAHSKSRLRGLLRHPMFLAVILWGIAHLLVRGDAASLLLWGGMIIWAIAGWMLTNARHRHYIPYGGGTLTGDIRLALITVVVFVVIVLIHGWVGPSPLPM